MPWPFLRANPLSRRPAATLVLLAALCGCGQQGRVGPGVPAPPGAPSATPPARAIAVPHAPAQPPPAVMAPLAMERQWLARHFVDTPVGVAGDDRLLRVTVPLRHAFDDVSTDPRPGLRAVLDRLALSMRRQPGTRLQAAVPGPGAAERLAALRGHLQLQGVPGWRVGTSSSTAVPDVQLLLSPAPVSIGRLDDRQLPRCSAARAGSSPSGELACGSGRP